MHDRFGSGASGAFAGSFPFDILAQQSPLTIDEEDTRMASKTKQPPAKPASSARPARNKNTVEERPEPTRLEAIEDRQLVALISALRTERERQGLGRWRASLNAGLSELTIRQLEQGYAAKPNWSTLSKYAKGLGFEIRWTLKPIRQGAEPGGPGRSSKG